MWVVTKDNTIRLPNYLVGYIWGMMREMAVADQKDGWGDLMEEVREQRGEPINVVERFIHNLEGGRGYGCRFERRVTVTMAGGSPEWWNYVVIVEREGDNAELFIESREGLNRQRGSVLVEILTDDCDSHFTDVRESEADEFVTRLSGFPALSGCVWDADFLQDIF